MDNNILEFDLGVDRIVHGRYPWLESFLDYFSTELSNELKMSIYPISIDTVLIGDYINSLYSTKNIFNSTFVKDLNETIGENIINEDVKKSDSIIYNYKINCNTSKQYLNFLVSADESFLFSSSLIFNKFFSELVVGSFKVVLNDLINSYITFEYVDNYRTKLNDRYNVLRNISKRLYCGNNQEFICVSFEIEEKKDSIGLLKILFPICFLYELTKMGVNLKKSNIAKNDFAKNDLSKISIDCEIRTESIKKSINDLLKIKIGDIVLFSKKKKIYINDKEFIYE